MTDPQPTSRLLSAAANVQTHRRRLEDALGDLLVQPTDPARLALVCVAQAATLAQLEALNHIRSQGIEPMPRMLACSHPYEAGPGSDDA